MNNKIFLKMGWMLIISLLAYLFFVVFFLSPKVNTYLSDTEIKNERLQFNKVVSIINNKSKSDESNKLLVNEVELLLSSVTLAKTGHIYIFNSYGEVIVDPSNEFDSKDISKLILPNTKNKLLLNEIKDAYNSSKSFSYLWNRVYDPYNYEYEKLSWVDYNKKLDWYIVSSIYADDFSSYVEGINSLILNISVLLFAVLAIIGIFISLKVIAPINKVLNNVQNAQVEQDELGIPKSKDEIGFLANQFNSLLDQVETNKKSIEDHVNQKTKEIRNKLYYDEVTTLKNRYALEENTKNDEFVSIALLDIDSFDDINELYGFSTGNIVLIQTGKILKEFCMKYNFTVYRIHGNVFAIVDKKMMEFSEYDTFVNDLSTLFKNRPIHIEQLDIDIFIDITIGVSLAQEEPLKTATIALKRAKKNNLRIFAYNNELDTKDMIEKSMFWREKIKKAINLDNVIPFYQPIMNRDKEIVKYETLMRLKDENDMGEVEFLLPYQFLDVAIKTKQYLQLSHHVISKALKDLSTKTKMQVSINLSFKDILDEDFIISLDKNLDNIINVDKERLVFEILESDHISDYTILEDFILKYRSQGIKIAIDDFGTGYSNFAHILKVKPDYIKIDGSLIKDINTDKNAYEMVKSIVDFSKALKITVIAEFIHSEEIFDIVNELGVDEFQGFFLGKPDPKIE